MINKLRPLNRLEKHLKRYNKPVDDPSDEGPDQFHYIIFLLTGLALSIFYLFAAEIFLPDYSNPLAEATTVLMFATALFFAIRQKKDLSFDTIFFIPLSVYLFYQAEFSITMSSLTTLHYLLLWYISGFTVMAVWIPFGWRYPVFLTAGMLSVTFHSSKTGLLDHFLSLNQSYAENPYFIMGFSFLILSVLRLKADRRLKKEAIRQKNSEEQLRNFFHLSRYPLAGIRAIADHDGNIVRLEVERINHAFETDFKTTLAEAQNQEIHYYFNLIFKTPVDWNKLFILEKKDKTEFYCTASDKYFLIQIFRYSEALYYCIFNDITREKHEVRLLQETRARYLALLQAIPDIFFVIDLDGIFQDVVFKGQESLLTETSEIIGNSIFKVGFSDLMAERIHQSIRKAVENDSIETIEYSLDARGGSLLYEMRLARLDDHSVISISRDITRRKKAEFALEAAKIRAEEADALKSKFLANLSHDIRTPLNIIIGLTKLLTEPSLSDFEKGEFIHDVQQQGNTLLQIIENTIQLSKIETNTLDVNIVYTNIHQLLRELYLHFYPSLPDHREVRLDLYTGIRQNGEVGFETDPYLLKEALSRLIENAIRFTPAGTVQFGYNPVSGNSVEFFVSDTGPGIPPAETENIFLRFFVIESDRQSQKSGAGLGLPIAQHFVALIGGELKVDSEYGKGSRFWFRLPLRNPKGFLRVI